MKLTSLTFLAVAAACGFASAQTTAYTTPVGYYNFDAKAGGNIFVPGFANSPVFAGAITAATNNSSPTPDTLTVATGSITANAFNEGAAYATHYVEITQAGANQGIVIDIVSNTNAQITLASDISALGLTGAETIAVRPHVTLRSVFLSAEAQLGPYSDAATFLNSDGSINTYYFIGSGDWASDLATPDGNDRPIPPGTGIIFDTLADVELTVVGEVKTSDTVVQIPANGISTVVGPVNPLVGDSDLIKNLGFADMAAYSDSITIYAPGLLFVPTGTYYALGDGEVSTDLATPSTDTFSFTKGGIFNSPSETPTSFRIKSGL